MKASEQQLWEKINDFQLDKEGVSLSFSKRLARENGFSEQFAKEIVAEYKKFIFMCCISEQPVTPSNYVDLAWHLHLTYTKSYWIDLCENTLQKELHHTPTEGGKSERSKFKGCYEYTIDFYEKTFEKKPNPDIWENTQKRFEINFINVDKTQNWIIPKIKLRNSFTMLLLILLSSVLFVGCPSGNETVMFSIFGIMVFVAIITSIGKNIDKQNDPSRKKETYNSETSSYSTSGGDGGGSDSDYDGEGDGEANGDGDSGGDSGCSGCGGCGGGGGD
jgi:hypothetical protein